MINKTHLSNQEFYSLLVETQEALNNLSAAVASGVFVPNSWLPKEYHDRKRGGRSLERINKISDKKEGVDSEYQKNKAAKAYNIKLLSQQVAANRDIDKPLDYSQNITNEASQYRSECAMVKGMLNSGLIQPEDLEEN
jgi:hypothetical protein